MGAAVAVGAVASVADTTVTVINQATGGAAFYPSIKTYKRKIKSLGPKVRQKAANLTTKVRSDAAHARKLNEESDNLIQISGQFTNIKDINISIIKRCATIGGTGWKGTGTLTTDEIQQITDLVNQKLDFKALEITEITIGYLGGILQFGLGIYKISKSINMVEEAATSESTEIAGEMGLVESEGTEVIEMGSEVLGVVGAAISIGLATYDIYNTIEAAKHYRDRLEDGYHQLQHADSKLDQDSNKVKHNEATLNKAWNQIKTNMEKAIDLMRTIQETYSFEKNVAHVNLPSGVNERNVLNLQNEIITYLQHVKINLLKVDTTLRAIQTVKILAKDNKTSFSTIKTSVTTMLNVYLDVTDKFVSNLIKAAYPNLTEYDGHKL